ncbi:unnamed protein product [marine sediment metagenome]|uniref:Uncharacterized protein n=2 Tax=marine sediment metagenome TaxID=412755 RepID=X1D7M5_9ZZZZ
MCINISFRRDMIKYSWDGHELRRKQDIKNILDLAIELNSLNSAINQLRETSVINKDLSLSYYEYMVSSTTRCKEWRSKQKEHREQLKHQVLELMDKGFNYSEIGRKLNINNSFAWYLVNKREVLDKSELKKAKKIVNHWNKYSLKSSVLTQQTIQAFELLGLDLPTQNK